MGEQAKSKDADAFVGCAAMIILPVIGVMWLVGKCTGPDKPPEPVEVVDYCPERRLGVTKAEGEIYKIKADIEIAKNAIATRDPRAMATYRAMVAADIGIPPSQANGWREVFKGRLNAAEASLPKAERDLEEAQRLKDIACS